MGLKKKYAFIICLVINVLIVLIMFIVISRYSDYVKKKNKLHNIDLIEKTTSSISGTVKLFYEQQHYNLLNKRDYIKSNISSLKEAREFLTQSSTNGVINYQLVNCHTLQGYSVIPGYDSTEVEYNKNHKQVIAICNLAIENKIDDNLINTSAVYTNPVNGSQSIAFYAGITKKFIDDKTDYVLLGVISMADMTESGLSLVPYEDAAGAIINADGKYIVKTSAFKSENFYEFLRIYNNLGYNRSNELKHQVLSHDKGSMIYKNAKDTDCIYAYQKISGADGWYYISLVQMDRISNEVVNYTYIGIIMAFVFVLILIDGQAMLYLNRGLKKSLILADEAKEAAVYASKAKSEFLSRMSHEIRTPLNAIIGYNTIAKNALPKHENDNDVQAFENKISDCMQKSGMASKHLLSVINDILDMSSIESGKMKTVNDDFDFKGLISTITTMFYSIAKSKGINFEVKLLTLLDERIMGDSVRINQVLTNLLGNSMKFTPKRGNVILSVSQENIDEEHANVCFIVSDTGIGMEKEFLENIWMPFEQENAHISHNFGGSGLGLAITKKLVEMMGGTITVKSEKNKGSVFQIHIIFDRILDNSKKDSLYNFKKINALIVDDEESSCEYLKLLLDRSDIRCDIAKSGYEAIEKVKKARMKNDDYTLCLVDWLMPGIDGIETVKMIRETSSNVPAVIVTAYDYTEVADSAKMADIDSFISKPVFQSTLFDILVNISGNTENNETVESKNKFDGIRILLAEDNEMNMEIAYELLTGAGFIVDKAWNGQEALEAFNYSEEGKYKAILMDVRMPVMNGYDATIAIRNSNHEQAKTIPIIAMTADAFEENINEAIKAGMNMHVAKPIDVKELFTSLSKCLYK